MTKARSPLPFQTILITGTTSGLGLALLERFHDRGAEVICINRRRSELLESRFPRARFEMIDITDSTEVNALVGQLVSTVKRPILCILNAAVNPVDNEERFNAAEFSMVLRINLLGVTNFVGAFESLVEVKSVILTIGSTAVWYFNRAHLGYYLSKLVLHHLHRSLWRTGTRHSLKLVFAGPMMTGIAAQGHLSGIRRTVFVWLAAPVDAVAEKVERFANGSRRVLVVSLRAAAFYFLVGMLDRLAGIPMSLWSMAGLPSRRR